MEWRTQENASVEELRRAKGCAPTKEGFVRFQALELLYEGYEKAEVARISNRSIRTIERWEAAFDARGIEGVTVKGRADRPRKIPREQSVLKQRTFTSWYAKSLNELLERTATGIQALIANPSELSSITSFSL